MNVGKILSCLHFNIWVTHFFQETTWSMLSQLTSFSIVKFVYILFTITKAFYQNVTTSCFQLSIIGGEKTFLVSSAP